MAEQRNTSYDNCMNQLHARYDGRGVSVNIANERQRRDMASPNAYLIARRDKGGVSDKYKNGEFNGQKYMTTGDFLKYYNSHKTPVTPTPVRRPAPVTKEFASPKTNVGSHPERRLEARPEPNVSATRPIRKYDPKADTIVMPAIGSRKKIKNRIVRLFEKWFPAERGGEKSADEKKNIPVASIALIISASVAMTLIVSTTVMVSDARTELSNTKYEIRQLQKEEAALEEELVKRDDLEMINEYAQNKLGMIRKEFVSSSYMDISEGDGVNSEIEDGGDELATLLSAMFGN